MERRRRRLPLNELAAFEAAAETGSFSAAARQLGMTQSAISHHVANLEADLGVRLFERVWRGVRTTEAGAALHEALSRGLDLVDAGLTAARSIGARRQLTVHTDFAFASFWLVPRLGELQATVPDIDVRIVTSQTSGFDLDFSAGDVAIHFGMPPRGLRRVVRLVGEEVVPVASPALARTLSETFARAEALAASPLLHLEGGGDRWLTWMDYLAQFGAVRRRGARDLAFTNYPLLLDAAIAGQGFALGWRPLIEGPLARGLLAEIDLPPLATQRGYHLVLPQGRTETAVLRDFCRWINAAFAAPDGA